jgi:uncharacterized damage-inducible protein DinB
LKKVEVVEQVRASHDKLVNALVGLHEEEASQVGLNPHWSIKDVLSHIVAWEQEGTRIIREVEAGTRQPSRLSKDQIDEFNARAVADRRASTMAEVNDEFRDAHAEMLALINTLPGEVDESSVTYKYIYGVTIRHMAHHAAQISEYRNSRNR